MTQFTADIIVWPQGHENAHAGAPAAGSDVVAGTESHGGGHEGGFNPVVLTDWSLWFWSAVTFGCLLVLLTKFAWKPIVTMVEDREKKIRGDIDAAEKARADAESSMKKLQLELEQGAVKAREIVEGARTRAEQVANETVAAAKATAEATVARALQQIEAEKDRALAEARTAIVDLSLAVTREVVRRTSDQDLHAAIAGEVLSKAKKAG